MLHTRHGHIPLPPYLFCNGKKNLTPTHLSFFNIAWNSFPIKHIYCTYFKSTCFYSSLSFPQGLLIQGLFDPILEQLFGDELYHSSLLWTPASLGGCFSSFLPIVLLPQIFWCQSRPDVFLLILRMLSTIHHQTFNHTLCVCQELYEYMLWYLSLVLW